MQQTVSPQQLSGTIAAIPSKSWAHRELIAAALGAPNHAVLVRFRGGSNDIEATCRALRGLGAKIERLPGTGARVEGISPSLPPSADQPASSLRDPGVSPPDRKSRSPAN